MASMIFSDEEVKYLRAVLKWQEKPPDDNRASWMLGLRMPEKKPVGEFRVLVIGAKGVGKTSILKKVSQVLSQSGDLINSYYVAVVLHRCFPRPLESGLVKQHQWLPT